MPDSIIKKLTALAESYHLTEIYVFGSRAGEIAAHVKGQSLESCYPNSDVDIGIQPVRGYHLSARDKVELTIDLEDLLGVRRVDLTVMTEVGPFLALDIIRGELLYCKDPDEQAEHELYVLRVAGDLAYYERERRNQIFLRGE